LFSQWSCACSGFVIQKNIKHKNKNKNKFTIKTITTSTKGSKQKKRLIDLGIITGVYIYAAYDVVWGNSKFYWVLKGWAGVSRGVKGRPDIFESVHFFIVLTSIFHLLMF
jgi:hypothetical protein